MNFGFVDTCLTCSEEFARDLRRLTIDAGFQVQDGESFWESYERVRRTGALPHPSELTETERFEFDSAICFVASDSDREVQVTVLPNVSKGWWEINLTPTANLRRYRLETAQRLTAIYEHAGAVAVVVTNARPNGQT